ncbi:kinase-like domain-containing protein [Clohesyomyces aquaticus]|uniref:Kinase-like domain-containing protein n=1 Tax=Clohesyomyces aquaticus TaxID=1231657 RepID=A0A1Y1ZNN5_9PLEO|nr:kinase-like domain-containing protein [Clohesyomyces aquaticus]
MEQPQARLDEKIPLLSVVPPTEPGIQPEVNSSTSRDRALSSASSASASSYYTAFESPPQSPLRHKSRSLLPVSGGNRRLSIPKPHEPGTSRPQSPTQSDSSPYLTANSYHTLGSSSPLGRPKDATSTEGAPPHPTTKSHTSPQTVEIHVLQATSSSVPVNEANTMANGTDELTYETYIRENGLNHTDGKLIPSWSRRGRHVTFRDADEANGLLSYLRSLGYGAFSSVEAVRCPTAAGNGDTVLIVRKNMRRGTGKYLLEDFMKEVKHSARFKHKHMIQFVGTYSTEGNLALLQYPAGDDTLKHFMDNKFKYGPYKPVLKGFVKCLANAIRYLHQDSMVKHMDIKPQNVVIKRVAHEPYFTVLIIDFGLTRNINSESLSHSSGNTPFTREYAASEVVPDPTGMHDVSHTRRSDVFSLGCVFAEMATTAMTSYTLEDFKAHRNGGKPDENPSAFAAVPQRVLSWLDNLDAHGGPDLAEWLHITGIIRKMLQHHPRNRPTSQEVVEQLGAEQCCEEVFQDSDHFWS